MSNIIYSINAKDNGVLPVLEEHFRLNNKKMKREISNCFECLNTALKNTGVKYEDFRSSLLPANGDKHYEYLFVYRLIPDDNSIYEYIANNIVSLFPKDSRMNILLGDLILYNLDINQKRIVIEKLFKTLDLNIDKNWYANYFLIYVNNITNECVTKINDFFSNENYYLGCANVTFSSNFKSYISNHSVFTKYVKIGKNVFNSDADVDLDKHSKIHNGFWDWKWYNIYGINDIIFDTFLRYKIDTFQGNLYSSDDFRYNKIYITSNEKEKFDIKNVEIDFGKYEYLEKTKQIFKQINISKEKFLEEIRNKIKQQSYYNIEIIDEFNIVKFCIFLEFENRNKKIKKTLALKYEIDSKKIKIVSMY